MSRVQIKNLSFSIDGNHILKNISTSFPEKTLTCILGPNGAGKTTLLKSICQLIDYSGNILIHDTDIKSIDSNALARQVAYVPQTISPDISFTVEEFILLSRYPWQGVIETDKQQFEEIIRITGLENHLNQTLNTLSGGERQRALIAAALIQNTPVILLDEVTSALDPAYQEQMIKLLIKIRKTGKTLLWTTHDLTAALLYADTILTLKDGQIFALGTAEELIQNGTFDELYERKFETIQHPSLSKTILI